MNRRLLSALAVLALPLATSIQCTFDPGGSFADSNSLFDGCLVSSEVVVPLDQPKAAMFLEAQPPAAPDEDARLLEGCLRIERPQQREVFTVEGEVFVEEGQTPTVAEMQGMPLMGMTPVEVRLARLAPAEPGEPVQFLVATPDFLSPAMRLCSDEFLAALGCQQTPCDTDDVCRVLMNDSIPVLTPLVADP